MRAVEAEECDACGVQTHGADKQPEGSEELIGWAWVVRTIWIQGSKESRANAKSS